MFALLLLLTYKSYRRDWIPEDPNHKNINGIDKDEGEGREYSHTRLPGHESKYFSNQTAELAHYVSTFHICFWKIQLLSESKVSMTICCEVIWSDASSIFSSSRHSTRLQEENSKTYQ